MKKIFFLLAVLIFVSTTTRAQTMKPTKTAVKTTGQTPQTIKTIPAEPPANPPAPPPAPTQKTTGPATQTTPVYYLTSVRVIIKTGNDNKEFPSHVNVTLMAKATPANWRNYIQTNLNNEMRINSSTEFGLNVAGPPTSLEDYQKSGLRLSIGYEPNFFADAWKIESVSMVMEFKDQNGNPHPTLGKTTVVFDNAYGFLNNEYRYMYCYTNESFVPMTASISRGY